jgi:hypothetical protein
MNRRFKKVDYDQALDLTVRLGDCLPPDHLARFVVDSVAQPGLSALYAYYGPRGGEPYAPKCCWACCSTGMRLACSVRARLSVRRMRRCPFASSQARLYPDNDTLATFLPELKDLFVQVLLLAQEAGVLKRRQHS